MADVFAVLTTLGARASAMADVMDRVQGREPAAKPVDQAVPDKSERHARPARHQDQAESHADVIARYGSIQAALQPCKWEVILRSFVRRGSTFHAPPNERWTRSIYGYTPEHTDGPARNRAVQAIARAYPLPTNMQDALADMLAGKADRELRLVLGRGGNTCGLDLTARLRWELGTAT